MSAMDDFDFVNPEDNTALLGSSVLNQVVEASKPFNVSPMVKTDKSFTVGLTTPEGLTNEEFRHIVGAAYTAWVSDGELPSAERISSFLAREISLKRIEIACVSNEFSDAMAARGVPWEKQNGLTATQMLVLQIITNPTDRRKLETKLKAAGVTYTTYRAWLRQPQFSQYLNKVTEGMLVDHIPDFNTVLTNKALSGDLNALKFVYELSGRHDPNRQQVMDLQAVIQALVEIVTRNVSDAETLTRISNELHLTLVSHNVIKGERA